MPKETIHATPESSATEEDDRFDLTAPRRSDTVLLGKKRGLNFLFITHT